MAITDEITTKVDRCEDCDFLKLQEMMDDLSGLSILRHNFVSYGVDEEGYKERLDAFFMKWGR